ncbi:hypothetical protein [Actinoplanes teichomyceticus]|uniref:Terminase small subunit n=1 Tax=Actinoplanes teichomyceticus TaxID=1867 RepID=A0A561WAU4_ACTTI|nr:hypothetical protein [Actinoplanes teichomyceticus]TWG20979.1 hypothetical protein FHX34_103508 [Actinoplanes teichomyceticus]GIF14799.1 hypothetical protein Ate01nite_48310 [Actinoplanes teichomyceticus]
MPSGGARNRSGPQKDPTSLKSARIGHSLTSLPAEGYEGDVPEFPLPRVPVYDIWFENKERHKVLDLEATEARRERELELWAWAWSTPQGAAWAKEPWRWHSIAMWVRTSVICESAEATAADKNSLHRFADQIGLTPAGLKENGWKIAPNQVAEKRAERSAAAAPAAPTARDRWLKAVGGDA